MPASTIARTSNGKATVQYSERNPIASPPKKLMDAIKKRRVRQSDCTGTCSVDVSKAAAASTAATTSSATGATSSATGATSSATGATSSATGTISSAAGTISS